MSALTIVGLIAFTLFGVGCSVAWVRFLDRFFPYPMEARR